MSPTNKPRTASVLYSSLMALVLPLLLAACATGGGLSPDQPAAPAIAETPPDAAAEPAAVTAGRRMFRAVCTGYCHSTTPGVTKDAPNLFDCNWDHGSEDADLYRVITQGVPDTEMLPFDGKIPDDTIWQVITYIRSNSMDCGTAQ